MAFWTQRAFAVAIVVNIPLMGQAIAQQVSENPRQQVGFRVRFVPSDTDYLVDVQGFSFGLIADRAGGIHGLQLTSIFSQASQEVGGAQVSLGFNLGAGGFRGVQAALLGNFTAQGRGLQLAGGINNAQAVRGVQIGLVNTAEDATGVQIGGGNRAERFLGARIGVVNSGEEEHGVTIGLLNDSRAIDGLEIGLLNIPCPPFPSNDCPEEGRETHGAEIGLLNVARTAVGFQFAVVNVADDASGFQLGLVNFAIRNAGESFALLNINGDGVHELAVFASDILWSNIALKLGARHLYTDLVAGYQPGDALENGMIHFLRGSRRFGLGIGVGWRAPLALGRIETVEIEASAMNLRSALNAGWSVNPVMSSLRDQIAVRLFRHLTLLAALAVNVAIGVDGRDANVGLGLLESVSRSGDTTLRLFPGFTVGVQI
jgi:hypothetical protein